ncbi:hypothetical protein HHI36_007459 [Cryptolaemus montrouzieri]|uniref:Uncharacterized protein n=1 Tax=Cryptolaemus montrouzieri TaxID=559131 RepID=A0ABD2MPV0_9CUCU
MAIQTSLRSEGFQHTIQESRQKFLEVLRNPTEEEEDKSRHNEATKKKSTPRKISFKVRRPSSIYRKNHSTSIQKASISASTVAELASKFNEIIEKQNAPNNDPNLKKLAKKLSNCNSNIDHVKTMKDTHSKSTNESKKEHKKPSIKKKPILEENVSKVQIIKRKASVSNVSSRPEVSSKEEKLDTDALTELSVATPENSREQKSVSVGFVKAAIKNFEKKNLHPITAIRSLSEIHKPNIHDVDTNRRKSCKPDLEIPNPLQEREPVERNESNRKEIKISSKSEPNLASSHLSESASQGSLHKQDVIETEFEPCEVNKRVDTKQHSNPDVNIPNPLREKDYSDSERRDIKINSNSEPNLVSSHIPLSTSKTQEISRTSLHKQDVIDEIIRTDKVKKEAANVDENDFKSKEIEVAANKVTLFRIDDHKQEPPKHKQKEIKPNTSFLWTKGQSSTYQSIPDNVKSLIFNTVTPNNNSQLPREIAVSKTLPRDFKEGNKGTKETIYEEFDSDDGYEPFDLSKDYEKLQSQAEKKEESDYEYVQNDEENIYETLPASKQNEPLPERPTSKNSGLYTPMNDESVSNCYESIYNVDSTTTTAIDDNYESIYYREKKDSSERDFTGSIVSSEQKTNSLYGTSLQSWNDGTIYNGSATSDLSDKSEWIDISDIEEDRNSKFIM